MFQDLAGILQIGLTDISQPHPPRCARKQSRPKPFFQRVDPARYRRRTETSRASTASKALRFSHGNEHFESLDLIHIQIHYRYFMK